MLTKCRPLFQTVGMNGDSKERSLLSGTMHSCGGKRTVNQYVIYQCNKHSEEEIKGRERAGGKRGLLKSW